MSAYPLIVHVQKLGSREARESEKLYKALMKKKFSCDTEFYTMLVDHHDQAIKFRDARNLLSLVMGRKCLNLLSPAHFYCHIRGCKKIVVTGGLSKLSIVERHWRDHQASSDDLGGRTSCSDIVLRYAFLKSDTGKSWLSSLQTSSLEKKFELLSSVQFEEELVLAEGNFTYIMNDTKFDGRPFLVDEIVLDGIIKGDHDSLSKAPKRVTMRSYFGRSKKSGSRSSSTDSMTSPSTSLSTLSSNPTSASNKAVSKDSATSGSSKAASIDFRKSGSDEATSTVSAKSKKSGSHKTASSVPTKPPSHKTASSVPAKPPSHKKVKPPSHKTASCVPAKPPSHKAASSVPAKPPSHKTASCVPVKPPSHKAASSVPAKPPSHKAASSVPVKSLSHKAASSVSAKYGSHESASTVPTKAGSTPESNTTGKKLKRMRPFNDGDDNNDVED